MSTERLRHLKHELLSVFFACCQHFAPILLQMGFFSIVGIPLYQALASLFEDAQVGRAT